MMAAVQVANVQNTNRQMPVMSFISKGRRRFRACNDFSLAAW